MWNDACGYGRSSLEGHITRLSKISTATVLELLLPENVSSPFLCSDRLNISYTLGLALSFEQKCSANTVIPWRGEMTIPMVVDMA